MLILAAGRFTFGTAESHFRRRSRLARLNGEGSSPQVLYGQDISVKTPDLGNSDVDGSTGEIRAGKKRAILKVTNLLGGLQIIGVDKKGDIFVSVLEIVGAPAIRIDETIHHYDRNLKLLDRARVPVAERYTHVERDVAVSEDGNVYSMIPRIDRLDIIRLTFKKELEPILPDGAERVEINALETQSLAVPLALAPCTRTRSQMTTAAAEYLNNVSYLTSRNLTGSCAGRTRPRYLGTTPGNKPSGCV